MTIDHYMRQFGGDGEGKLYMPIFPVKDNCKNTLV